MRVLIACEESQTVCKAFRALGHEAYSCDVQPCSGGRPEWHIEGDAIAAVYGSKWDLIIAHPPCTYLTVTGNKWFKDQPPRKSGALVGQARRDAREKALVFVKMLLDAPAPYIALENPVGVIGSRLKKPTQVVCPTMFGHREPKKTCLWLKGLPPLKPTEIVEPEYHVTASGKRMPKWYAYACKKDRSKIRSKTFQGMADAMASQWSEYVTGGANHAS